VKLKVGKCGLNYSMKEQKKVHTDNATININIFLQVFETAVSQDQLPVLSGWIFEALCHLLSGKITPNLLPYCVLTLLVSASSNQHIRKMSPLAYHVLKLGFHKCAEVGEIWGDFSEFLRRNGVTISFSDRRLLCVVATHSSFSETQLERLRELCNSSDCLADLVQCLNA
jgi:hypothetical protein